MRTVSSQTRFAVTGMTCIGFMLSVQVFAVLSQDKHGAGKPVSDAPLPDYQIALTVNYRAASFTGSETVSLTNSSREAIDTLNFHLYPNLGLEDENQPRLSVHRVVVGGKEVPFSLQSRGVLLRINLPGRVAPGNRTRVSIDFSARIPTVQPEETSLLAHFLDEVNDAMGEDRVESGSREIFFAGKEEILLGYFFPMLAAGEVRDPDRLPATGVKSAICAEVADYRVAVTVDDGLNVIGSGEKVRKVPLEKPASTSSPQQLVEFQGKRLRSFALILGENFKSIDGVNGETKVTAYSRPGSEKIAARVLDLATRAVGTFNQAFGPYGAPALQVVELPLPASFSGIDLPGIVVLAHAYFVDFEATQSHLPGIVRSQADVIKAALEFTLAHEIAHQWWGGIVGSDPQRAPFLDEALAQFSAVYFYEATEGAEVAERVVDQQVRGAYLTYRMFGGADVEVDRPLRDLGSRLQYAAITQAKGAFFLIEVRRQMGDERFFSALRRYFSESQYSIASPETLKAALLEASGDPRALRLLIRRWLNEKHADEDIGNPSTTLFPQGNTGIRKLGRIFVWIGRAAARPF